MLSTLEADAEDAKRCGGFLDAVQEGLVGAVRHFLKEEPTCVNKNDYTSKTSALHRAALKGYGSMVELLLKHKADVEAKDYQGFTALHFAAGKGHVYVVELLLKHGADAGAKRNERIGTTALHMAALTGHSSIVELLLKHNADVEAKENVGRRDTALLCAARCSHDSTVELLLKHGADAGAQEDDGGGYTALQLAVINCTDASVDLLLEHKADVGTKNDYGQTALHFAAWKDRGSTVELLLKHGADAGAENRDRKKPVDMAKTDEIKALLRKAEEEQRSEKEEVAQCKDILDAAEKGLLKAAEHFLGKDPKCMGTKNADGQTVLHIAAKHGHSSFIQMLLDRGVFLEAKDDFGQTALHWAAYCCHLPIVELLVRVGAVLDVQEMDGLTPAQLAKQEGNDEAADLLQKLEAAKKADKAASEAAQHQEKADAEEAAKCKGGMIEAARDGLVGAVRHLLKHDTECMQQKDKRSGKTALHLAAEKGNDSIVELLLSHNAAVDSKTIDGRVALHFAALNGHLSVAKLLVSQGATSDVKANNGKAPADVAEANGHMEFAVLLWSGGGSEEKGPAATREACLAGAAGLALRKKEVIEIPDGTNAPVSMFSARFDGGEIEQKFREVHKLLTEHNFANRMVSASGSDDFGIMTLKCLQEIKSKSGVMIAVCTPHYGEMTSSPYSSNAELRFALDERVKVLPLKVADVYPPEPPGGPGHKFDPDDTAKAMCRMVFKGSVVYLDCVNKSVQEITAMIANALLRM